MVATAQQPVTDIHSWAVHATDHHLGATTIYPPTVRVWVGAGAAPALGLDLELLDPVGQFVRHCGPGKSSARKSVVMPKTKTSMSRSSTMRASRSDLFGNQDWASSTIT